MSTPRSIIDRVRIASPCHVPWDSMTGGDHGRYCSRCDAQVFNFSDMTRPEAEDLIRAKHGRLCARYDMCHDGKVMTADCQEMVRLRRRRWVAAVVSLVFHMLIGLSFLLAFSG